MKKIIIFQEGWGLGGIETFVMNLIRHIDLSQYEVEIMSAYDWSTAYDCELVALGVARTTVFKGNMPNHFYRMILGAIKWHNILKAEDIDIVHINAMDGTTLIYAAIAKYHGIQIRIVHAHNSSFAGGMRKIKSAIHCLCKYLWGRAATHRLACSIDAGKYLFDDYKFEFIPNGIDTKRFAFDSGKRAIIRKKLGVTCSTLVIGSVGRLSYQKNPIFSIEVLRVLVSCCKNVLLVQIGEGDFEDKIKGLVNKYNLRNNYYHIQSVTNPEVWYSAMDIYLMPSLFEGLPYTILEAQCNGLPCLASKAIPQEACITDYVKRLDLSLGCDEWCDEILSMMNSEIDRLNSKITVEDSIFNFDNSNNRVLKIYSKV